MLDQGYDHVLEARGPARRRISGYAIHLRGTAVIRPELIADALLSTRSDAVVAADRDGVIRFWNPGAERIFGHAEATPSAARSI